ncbi:HAMP domain-containing protein [Chloroflexus sp.]|uniref:HAMP domain-containing protein n=1 Tax=Chloroflexus sp. TaxID=1904827 RepID=UPI003A1034B6
MTSTAAALSASDLTHRIGYTGPADEIGRLTTTFDAMLDRIAAALPANGVSQPMPPTSSGHRWLL